MDRCSCRGHCCVHRGRTRADGDDRRQLAIDRQSDTGRALQVCSKQRVLQVCSKQRVRLVRARTETTYQRDTPLVRLRRRTGNIPIWPGIPVAVPSPSPAGRRCRYLTTARIARNPHARPGRQLPACPDNEVGFPEADRCTIASTVTVHALSSCPRIIAHA
jgi:hypothetical protein